LVPSVLITGLSRRAGIAWTIADRLRAEGWDVSASGWPPHDAEHPWGADAVDPDIATVHWCAADLADPATPRRLIDEHVARYGGIDALVAAHARSSHFTLANSTAAEIDRCLSVNTRSTVLLVQAATEAGVRRVVLFTTGVHQDPMPDEIPYALSKAALQGITATLAAALAPRGATVNCINPGPTDTGYADVNTARSVAAWMPLASRWGQPADVARLVAWLVSDEAGWITGQTIDSDGGWGIRTGVDPRD
jgi:3-oxoacyl-[acyl-carrier protein] reductase